MEASSTTRSFRYCCRSISLLFANSWGGDKASWERRLDAGQQQEYDAVRMAATVPFQTVGSRSAGLQLRAQALGRTVTLRKEERVPTLRVPGWHWTEEKSGRPAAPEEESNVGHP